VPIGFFVSGPSTTGMLPQSQSAIIFATSTSVVVSKQCVGILCHYITYLIAYIPPLFYIKYSNRMPHPRVMIGIGRRLCVFTVKTGINYRKPGKFGLVAR
jgi:hypothetical protein